MNPLCCFTIPYTTASPSPVPLSGPFVVKNGSKMRSRVSSSIPIPVSLTESTAYRPAFMYGYCFRYSSSSHASSRFDHELPPSRHGIPRVEAQVHQDLLHLPLVGPDRRQPFRQGGLDLDVFSCDLPKEFHEIGHHLVQVKIGGLDDLATGEGEELPGEHRRPFRTAEDLVEVGNRLRVVRDPELEHFSDTR